MSKVLVRKALIGWAETCPDPTGCCDFLSHEIVLAPIGEERCLTVQQADINLLASSGLLPLIEGSQNTLGGKQAAGQDLPWVRPFSPASVQAPRYSS